MLLNVYCYVFLITKYLRFNTTMSPCSNYFLLHHLSTVIKDCAIDDHLR